MSEENKERKESMTKFREKEDEDEDEGKDEGKEVEKENENGIFCFVIASHSSSSLLINITKQTSKKELNPEKEKWLDFFLLLFLHFLNFSSLFFVCNFILFHFYICEDNRTQLQSGWARKITREEIL